MSIDIRILASGDEAVLANVAPGVFDHDVDPGLTAEFLRDPRHHLAVALDGPTVVGFASAVDYVHPDKPRELWINEVGVAPSHQRQGLGQRLLRAVLDLGHRGIRSGRRRLGRDRRSDQPEEQEGHEAHVACHESGCAPA